jgi:ABC-type methionine transport system ATPase subunit
MARREIKLTFPEELVTQPVIYHLGHDFKIVYNIKKANVTKDTGWVLLEITGENEEIEKAIEDLRNKGIKVEITDSSEYIDL